MKLNYCVISLIIILLITTCKKDFNTHELEIKTDNLVIYTTDYFINSGLVETAIAIFEDRFECNVLLHSFKESYDLLQHLIFEKDNPQADIILGILSPHLDAALRSNAFISYEPENIRNINNRHLITDRRNRLIPFSYNYYAFVYDTEIINAPPKTFGALQSSEWDDKIIMFDPEVTAIGLSALEWSLAIFGERGFEQFWGSLKNSILSISTDWASSYIAFHSGHAPMILGYVTNPVYHSIVEGTNHFSAFIPLEGTLKEIEYAGILTGSENIFLARRFMDFIISAEFQNRIPEMLWKFPVIQSSDTPQIFSDIVIPDNRLTQSVHDRKLIQNRDWIEIWKSIMAKD